MEIELKVGTVIQMEVPISEYENLISLDDVEDCPAILEWTFIPTGIPDILDIEVSLFMAYSSQKHYIDGWTCNAASDKIAKIKEYTRAALDTARERDVWQHAVEAYCKEKEED